MMIKHDNTTDEIKKVLQRGDLPDLGKGAPKVDPKIMVGSGNVNSSENGDAVSVVASLAETITDDIFHNPDDDYGSWVMSLVNINGEIQAKIQKTEPSSSGGVNTPIPLDGKVYGFASLRFDDKENNIYAEFWAAQGTLRYDPISRLRSPDNFRFQYWPWQFPNKIDCSAAFFNALQAENFRFCPFWEIALEVNPGGRPVTRSIRAQSLYSHAEMLRSLPVRWCLLGLIAARLV